MSRLKKVLLILWILGFMVQIGVQDEMRGRKKRALIVFPFGGTYKLVIGVGLPFMLGTGQTMSIGWNFQFQYPLAQNATQLDSYPPILTSRSKDKREVPIRSERALAYLGLESILDQHGINGRACLLRSICENAFDSLHHQANGLYGHLLHIALTPDYGDGEIEQDLDSVYLEAQKAGRFGVDCNSLYPECPSGYGLLDMITTVDVM